MAKSTTKLVNQLLNGLIIKPNETIDINLFNKKWTCNLINADEHLQAMNDSAGYEDYVARLFKLQQETLKLCLVSVDDIVLSKAEKNDLFSKCPAIVVINLYEAYDRIRSKREKELANGLNNKETDEQVDITEE